MQCKHITNYVGVLRDKKGGPFWANVLARFVHLCVLKDQHIVVLFFNHSPFFVFPSIKSTFFCFLSFQASIIQFASSVMSVVKWHFQLLVMWLDKKNQVSLKLLPKRASLHLRVVHKLGLQDKVGNWSKNVHFFQCLYYRKCQHRGVGSQKKSQNLVNVVCEQSLIVSFNRDKQDWKPFNTMYYSCMLS